MVTDVSEKGLESLIVRAMTGRTDLLSPAHVASENSAPVAGGTGWLLGDPKHYERSYCVDIVQLRGFLATTQPQLVEALALDADGPTRRQFLARLDKEVTKRGVVDVLRKGIAHGPHQIDLFYGTPSPGNERAAELFAENRFSVTRQLAYSRDETRRALDLGLFINGLPIATFELKNSLTKQTVEDAVEQYRRDRDPREPLFSLGRCVAHFAVDDSEVRFCTHLVGKHSWFLPFNQGHDDGAGNPPNPRGLKTAYLWERVLTRKGLTNILENYAQIVDEKNEKTGKKTQRQVFPRFHQLDVVRKLLADVAQHGVGKRYLIQHSAGSGKSNSIAWLAHQLIGVKRQNKDVFDSVIVVTDRRILDQQIHNTIKGFLQVAATVGHAERSGDLRRFIEGGKKIIISTVQKFPFILGEVADQKGKTFAIIIDEAHSSQGGKTASAMSEALSEPEDTVNDELMRRMQARKMLNHASYFAFTATPKNKTLELFGEALPADAEGKVRHRPFHSYTMKQAIEEGFILDVLKSYTPVNSYYKLVKTVEGDPEFDVKKARKKLRRYVESHETAIQLKAEIMVDHFHEQVLAQRKVGGLARAMVVTNGIERAIQYFYGFKRYLAERKSPYQAIVAFSGEHEYQGEKVTESTLNGFPSSEIPDRIAEDPYRFLICADKFQTGYDEPLLHTMYVDKALSDIKAVQTLSRLNRAHPDKHDVFVLDFQNNTDGIIASFADYYRTTVLSEETDPNKLHDLKHALDEWQVYSSEQVDELVTLFLGGADRDKLEPILTACVEVYLQQLDEDGQIDFKGKAKAFTRTYDFLASLLPYTNAEWEKLSIVLNLLIPKLPAPKEEDLARGILESIDMDSYRAEKQATAKLALPNAEAEIGPVPVAGGGRKLEPQIDRLSRIVDSFNEQFATTFADGDRIIRRLHDDIAPKVAADTAYQNAKQNTPQTARIEHDKALEKVMIGLLKDDTEVYKQFVQNPLFKRFVTDTVYRLTGAEARAPGSHSSKPAPMISVMDSADLSFESSTDDSVPKPYLADLLQDPRNVPLWYGTNRKPVDDTDVGLGFTGQRSTTNSVHLGRCVVNVPQGHKLGSIGSGWFTRLVRGDDRLRLLALEPITEAKFWQDLAAAFSKNPGESPETLLFVHGYRVTFEDAAIRAAQLAYDLKIRDATFFSWPSAGSTAKYMVDEASAKNAVPLFAEFLASLDATAFAAGKRLNVIAHSMGNRVLLGALDRLILSGRKPKAIDKLVFAAPDEDAADFKHALTALTDVGTRRTLYASSKDKPVWLSEVLHEYPRAGRIPPVTIAAALDTIDASELEATFLGHGDFASERPLLGDLFTLLKNSAPPADRLGLEGALTSDGEPYWRIK